MKKKIKNIYTFSFNGRKVGSIGKTENLKASYNASTLDEAKKKIWIDYEHITQLKLI